MEVLVGAIALVLGLVIGVFVGVFIGTDRMRKAIEERSVGRLRIDHSEPDEPTRLFTELKGVTPEMIAEHDYVIFEVVDESYLVYDEN